MGLDMYLKAERYVSGYEWQGQTLDSKRYKVLAELLDAEQIADPNTPTCAVSFTCAYWRKANAIHSWFVRTVQNDVDDCGDYGVEREQLEALKALCQGLLDAKDSPEWATLCETQLPAANGFFFGSTEYDENYVEDLQSTVKQLDRVLKATAGVGDTPFSGWDFEYHSSW